MDTIRSTVSQLLQDSCKTLSYKIPVQTLQQLEDFLFTRYQDVQLYCLRASLLAIVLSQQCYTGKYCIRVHKALKDNPANLFMMSTWSIDQLFPEVFDNKRLRKEDVENIRKRVYMEQRVVMVCIKYSIQLGDLTEPIFSLHRPYLFKQIWELEFPNLVCGPINYWYIIYEQQIGRFKVKHKEYYPIHQLLIFVIRDIDPKTGKEFDPQMKQQIESAFPIELALLKY